MLDINTDHPDYVNEQGVKWWIDKDLTKYSFDRGFSGTRVFVVERPDGYRTRLFTEGENILAESQSLEGICSKIDIISISRRYCDE